MKQIVSWCLAFCIVTMGVLSAQIRKLPAVEYEAAPDAALLSLAFQNLHQFSEKVYRSKKIAAINQSGYLESPDRWDPGTWGRGYFTWFVDIPSLRDPAGKEKYYANWYDGERQWGTHPLIRDTGRRVVAYINKYSSGDRQEIYKNRIHAGMRYLVDQQSTNTGYKMLGSYIWWAERPGKSKPNLDDTMPPNFGILYSTGLAVRALVEGYYFCQEFGWPNDLAPASVMKTVKVSANWLFQFTTQFDRGTYNREPEKISLSPIDIRSFSVWGLTSAYRLLQDHRYLLRAFDIYQKNISGYQDENGAWYYNYGGLPPFQDTMPYYTGIVLRALADLYDVLPDGFDLNRSGEAINKATLKRQILATINLFLTPDLGANPQTGKRTTRLQPDGNIFPYYRLYEQSPARALASHANELVIGLHYALNTPGLLSDTDRERALQLVDACVNKIARDARGPITPSADVWMNVLAHYYNLERQDMPSLERQMLSYQSSGDARLLQADNSVARTLDNAATSSALTVRMPSGRNLVVNGNFDADLGSEIAFYSRKSGQLDIFDFSANTTVTHKLARKKLDLMVALDSNDDGIDELALLKSGRNPVLYLYDTELRRFVYEQRLGEGDVSQMSGGDFDRDGKPELALYDPAGRLYLFDAESKSQPVKISMSESGFDLMSAINADDDGFEELAFYRKKDNRLMIYDVPDHISIRNRTLDVSGPFDMLSTRFDPKDGMEYLLVHHKKSNRVIVVHPRQLTAVTEIPVDGEAPEVLLQVKLK